MVRLENLSVAGVRSPRSVLRLVVTSVGGKGGGLAQMMVERCTDLSLMAALSVALA